MANNERMGNTILMKAVDTGKPVKFTPPPFAKHLTEHQLRYRVHSKTMKVDASMAPDPEEWLRLSANSCAAVDYGYWWLELMGDGEDIIPNDIYFDETAENAMIYVLTGPNRGGKSVITCAIGLCQAMLQLGMYLPAKVCEISPADGIFTHFPTGADDTIDKGRLGEECARLGEIFDAVTAHSLVLLDESLSSTGSFEASYIAAEVLAGLSQAGCRCLFATHLHELAQEIDRINAEASQSGGVKIDTLVAGIEEGKRSFRIVRAKPDGKSYARDIAERYGLTYQNILEKIKN